MCGSCKTTFRVKEEHAGKRGTCPRWRAAVEVPSQSIEAEAESTPTRLPLSKPTQQLVMQEILAAFEGEIQPVKRTIGYTVGLLILALAMLILPALYLGMIAVIAHLLFLHATNTLGSGGPIRGL